MSKQRRDGDWWRASEVAKVLLSGRSIRDIAARIGISAGRARLLRKRLIDDPNGPRRNFSPACLSPLDCRSTRIGLCRRCGAAEGGGRIVGTLRENADVEARRREAVARRNADPDYQALHSAAMARLRTDAGFQAAHAARKSRVKADPAYKHAVSRAATDRHAVTRSALRDTELASRDRRDMDWLNDPRPLGVCLKAWQAGHGLTRNEAAPLLGIARSTYDACCTGRPLAKKRHVRDAMQRYDQRVPEIILSALT